MATPVAAIFGGSGFIGRYIVERLAKQGWIMRIAVRRPDQALFLKPLGDIAQIVPIGANIRHERSVANAVQGVDTVINLVGILHEGGRQRFNAVHVEGVRRLARAASGAGVRRFLHVSSLSADLQSRSSYARSKAEGEATLREHFPAAIILRPSIVFGPEDDFFNRFAAMAQVSPALPLIGGIENDAEDDHRPCHDVDRAQPVAEKMLDQESDGECGKSRNRNEECQPRPIIHAPAEQTAEAGEHRQHIAPEVD